jgi:ubiquinone/menaquinone biosynthesis C-methylase UbiE
MRYKIFPKAEKAAKHLYRVAKPGGKCYITSWKDAGYKHIAIRVIKRLRREEGNYDIPLIFWKNHLADVEYLATDLQKVRF